MERTAALTLAHKIESTWFDRPWPQAKSSEWIDALETLDEGAAGTAFVRLRASGGHGMTIAQFINATRAVHPHDASTRPNREPCAACSDSGWVETDDLIEPNGGEQPITYTQVKPCMCTEGRARAESSVWRQHHARQERAA